MWVAARAWATLTRATWIPWSVGRPLGALRALTGKAGWRLVEISGRGTRPGVAARLPLRRCDGVARGVEARRTARTARLLSLVARRSRVARPGARVTAGHHRARCPGSAPQCAGAVAILAILDTATLSGRQCGG
jgi:hypothetical protein